MEKGSHYLKMKAFQGGSPWRAGVITSLIVGLLCTSCTSIGSKKLVSTHTAYNDAVQLTVTREVLANIVRSRYSDPMQFLAVSAINAQFSVSTGGSAAIGGLGQEGTAGQVGGSIGYSDSPTITFIPQSDAGFYKSMFSPFEVGEAVGLGVSYRFGRTDSTWQAMKLQFSFASINGENDYSIGRSNPLYQQRIDALVRILDQGGTLRQIPEWDFDTTAIARDKVTAEDMVKAFSLGINFVSEDDGQTLRLARYRMVLALIVSDPNAPETINDLQALGVQPGRDRYVLRPPLHSAPGEIDPYAIWVTTRSMADALSLATRFVEVPEAHSEIVSALGVTTSAVQELPSVRIRSTKSEPDVPYCIQHRGYWFYVDDRDMISRSFLEGIVAAYSSRVGSKQAGDDAPQMVISVGG